MATNLAIDPSLLDRAVQVSGERTKKAAVTKALQEFIARREQQRVCLCATALHKFIVEDRLNVSAISIRGWLDQVDSARRYLPCLGRLHIWHEALPKVRKPVNSHHRELSVVHLLAALEWILTFLS